MKNKILTTHLSDKIARLAALAQSEDREIFNTNPETIIHKPEPVDVPTIQKRSRGKGKKKKAWEYS